MKNVRALFKLQKTLMNVAEVKKTILRFKNWTNTFTGNEEEGLSTFLNQQLTQVMSRPENQHLDESNALMIQYVLAQAKTETGEPVFDLFDLLRFKWLVVERDGYYQLE